MEMWCRRKRCVVRVREVSVQTSSGTEAGRQAPKPLRASRCSARCDKIPAAGGLPFGVSTRKIRGKHVPYWPYLDRGFVVQPLVCSVHATLLVIVLRWLLCPGASNIVS